MVRGYSLYVFVNDLGAAVGPIVGTALYMKSPIFPFVVASVICLVTGIVVAIVAGNRVIKTYGDETKGY